MMLLHTLSNQFDTSSQTPDNTQEKAHTYTGPTDTTHVCVSAVCLPIRVHGGNTSRVVPTLTRTGGLTAQVRTWVVPVFVCAFSCDTYMYLICAPYRGQ